MTTLQDALQDYKTANKERAAADKINANFHTWKLTKKYNKYTPLPFTNGIVIDEIRKEVELADPANKYESKGFVGLATGMAMTDRTKYEGYLKAAGFVKVEL